MKIELFIDENDVDCSNSIASIETIVEAEKEIGVSFGNELRQYLLTWGYLGFESVEFYGINSRQKLKSDMVLQTVYIHTYFPSTCEYVAIENIGEGRYALVDNQDNVFIWDSEQQCLINCKQKLFEYILSRFNEEKQ